ncbi:MAG: phosphoribosylamine--glycine ligase [Planctomycetes bacterium]|nr:phosphoribosylamine--glycine ligase [Planctomycetota bacterium]
MKVLVIGSGGREHALAWKLSQSPLLTKLYCAPGNPGMAELAECVNIPADSIGPLMTFADREKIDLTVVGPEDPLAAGIVDAFADEGLLCFGPNRRAAELESNKAFAKNLMKKHGITTAPFQVFDALDGAKGYIESSQPPIVVKAYGLAKGKGVFVCSNRGEANRAVDIIMKEGVFGTAGDKIIIESCLSGPEASILAITDGSTIIPLPTSQDHKRAFDSDRGPNTGGMGAYSPAPVITAQLGNAIEREIIVPTIHAMKREDRPYSGVLYAGVMITENGPSVLEYNCRFGDPETQPILMRLKSDLLAILHAATLGELEKMQVEWDPRPAVCVVMASGGYPGKYEKGKVIEGLDEVGKMPQVQVFHAGTAVKNANVVTAGGRVLGVTALGDTLSGAVDLAYEAVEQIGFEGAHYRKDIARRALHT